MKRFAIGSFVAISMLAGQAFAQTGNNATYSSGSNVTYNYAGVQYMFQDWDGCDQDGLDVYGSLDIDNGFFAQASLSDVDGDTCGSTSVTVGGGYHAEFNDIFDMYGTVSFQTLDYDGGDDSGLAVAAGLRGFIADNLETKVELRHATVGDGETTIGGGLAYWFNSRFSITGDASIGSDTTTFMIGGRMAF